MPKAVLGHQLLVEFFDCSPALLDDANYVREAMLDAAKATGATVVGELIHQFNPYGVSGVIVIAESHFAIHTWPEYCYAAVDLFTCGDEIDPHRGFEVLKKRLEAESFDITAVERGLLSRRGEVLPHKPQVTENA
ncbi:adenosylmethionine decarboxylase [Calditrichota bacterium]